MAEVLDVQLRKTRGKRNARRLRATGSIPAVLYGHGEENVALSVPAAKITAALRQGNKLVKLAGAAGDDALIREVQWDTYGVEVLHVDLTRVSAHELIEVTVAVTLRGEAPGIKEGGHVEQLVHEVDIECEAASIPDKLEANINHLKLGETITVADLDLPEKARLLGSPEAVVVQCIEVVEQEEEEVAEIEPAEPELLGRKPGEEETEEGKG